MCQLVMDWGIPTSNLGALKQLCYTAVNWEVECQITPAPNTAHFYSLSRLPSECIWKLDYAYIHGHITLLVLGKLSIIYSI